MKDSSGIDLLINSRKNKRIIFLRLLLWKCWSKSAQIVKFTVALACVYAVLLVLVFYFGSEELMIGVLGLEAVTIVSLPLFSAAKKWGEFCPSCETLDALATTKSESRGHYNHDWFQCMYCGKEFYKQERRHNSLDLGGGA